MQPLSEVYRRRQMFSYIIVEVLRLDVVIALRWSITYLKTTEKNLTWAKKANVNSTSRNTISAILAKIFFGHHRSLRWRGDTLSIEQISLIIFKRRTYYYISSLLRIEILESYELWPAKILIQKYDDKLKLPVEIIWPSLYPDPHFHV